MLWLSLLPLAITLVIPWIVSIVFVAIVVVVTVVLLQISMCEASDGLG